MLGLGFSIYHPHKKAKLANELLLLGVRYTQQEGRQLMGFFSFSNAAEHRWDLHTSALVVGGWQVVGYIRAIARARETFIQRCFRRAGLTWSEQLSQCCSGLASHMATEQRVLAAGALDALIHALRRDVCFLACCCIKADGITTRKANKKEHEQQQK